VLVASAAVLAGVMFTFVAMAALLRFYERREAALSPPASPLAASYGRKEAPAPRLQTHPARDIAELLALEAAQLGSYGWVDRPAGRVHIPIERAMDMLAAKRGEAP
jgi:hypothetical protein